MIIHITLPDVLGRLEKVKAAAQTTPEDMRVVGTKALEIIYERTCIDGQDKFGTQFKPYSTRPTYIGGDYLSYARQAGGRTTYMGGRKRATGKKTKTGKEAKTGTMKSVYFERGYSQFKQGLQPSGRGTSGVVNLIVRGDLMGSTGVFDDGQGDAAFGITENTADTVMLGFTRSEQEQKADGIIESGRDFWGVGETEDERIRLTRVLMETRIEPRVREAMS